MILRYHIVFKLHELHVALFEIDLAVLIIGMASYKGLSIELVFSYYDMEKNQEKVFIYLYSFWRTY